MERVARSDPGLPSPSLHPQGMRALRTGVSSSGCLVGLGSPFPTPMPPKRTLPVLPAPHFLREGSLQIPGRCPVERNTCDPHPAPQTCCLFINKRMPRLFWAPVIFYLNNQGSGCLPISLPCPRRQNRGNAIFPGVMRSGARPHC